MHLSCAGGPRPGHSSISDEMSQKHSRAGQQDILVPCFAGHFCVGAAQDIPSLSRLQVDAASLHQPSHPTECTGYTLKTLLFLFF